MGIFLHVNSRPTTDDDDVTTIVLSRAVTIRRVPSPHPYSYTKAARNTHTLTRFALRTPSLRPCPMMPMVVVAVGRSRGHALRLLCWWLVVAHSGKIMRKFSLIFYFETVLSDSPVASIDDASFSFFPYCCAPIEH